MGPNARLLGQGLPNQFAFRTNPAWLCTLTCIRFECRVIMDQLTFMPFGNPTPFWCNNH